MHTFVFQTEGGDDRGCHTEGALPGGLGVSRRAAAINRRLLGDRGTAFMARVQGFFDNWGRRVLLVLLVVLGTLMVVDAALYFVRGTPLVPVGWPGE